MRIPNGRQHAAEVRGDGLQDDDGDDQLLFCLWPNHVQNGKGKRHKGDERNVVSQKHAGKKAEKKQKLINKPLHYRSSDGYDIFIGKNNFQNDELTFQLATGNDWWFHAKGCAGSHVIVKTNGKTLPDATFEEAARLAAYYSKGRLQDKVEIDYLEKKNVKKPNGSKPGFVVYYTNYSMMAAPDISNIKEAE